MRPSRSRISVAGRRPAASGRRLARVIAAAAAAALAGVIPALAARAGGQDVWNSSVGGNWFDDSSWSLGHEPYGGDDPDDAYIGGVAVYIPQQTWPDPDVAVANSLTLVDADLTAYGKTRITYLYVKGGFVRIQEEDRYAIFGRSEFGTTAASPQGVMTTTTVEQTSGYFGGNETHLGVNQATTYSLHGGTLGVATITLGEGADATFNQDGGAIDGATLVMAQQAGVTATFTLTGGSVPTSVGLSGLTVGRGGSGTFHQNGGYVNARTTLTLAENAGSTGVYNLNAGTLDLTNGPFDRAAFYVGYGGTGTFNQQAGTTNTGAGVLTLGSQAGSTGTYHLFGGTLRANGSTIGEQGVGHFVQDAGDASLGSIYLGKYGGQGDYVMHAGTLTADAIVVGNTAHTGPGYTGTFTADGGLVNANTVYLGANAGASGKVSVTGGTTLNTTSLVSVGGGGSGEFYHGAAAVHVGGDLYVQPNGLYTLDGGTLGVGGTLRVLAPTATSTPTFDHTDGVVDAYAADIAGLYRLRAGTLKGQDHAISPGGVLEWTGGTIGDAAAPGITRVQGGELLVSGSGNRPLVNRSLRVNDGTFRWTGATPLVASDGTTVRVDGAGVFQVENDQTFSTVSPPAGTDPTFVNNATLRKISNGVTVFDAGTRVASGGTVAAEGGVLQFAGPLSATGQFNVSGAAQVEATATGTFAVADAYGSPGWLNKNGAGTLVVSAAQSHPSGAVLAVNQGTLTMNSNAGSPSARTLEIQVAQGASAAFNTTQHLSRLVAGGSVTLAPGRNLVVANSVEVGFDWGTYAYTGKVDVADGGMVVHPGDPSAFSSLLGYVTNAYAANTWTGGGITSSDAIASPATRAVGIATGATAMGLTGSATGTFLGETVDGDSVLLRLTLPGDANLDGTVDGVDQQILSSNYNATGANWSQGDFNYDGVVNFDDQLLLSKNYNQSLPADPAAAPALVDSSPVPEPAATGLLAFAAGSLTLRGRRRKDRGPLSPAA